MSTISALVVLGCLSASHSNRIASPCNRNSQADATTPFDEIRYAIDDGTRDFSEAHEHVAALAAGKKGLGTVVSLKSSANSGASKPAAKRKGDGAEGNDGGDEQRKKKKTRRSGVGAGGKQKS